MTADDYLNLSPPALHNAGYHVEDTEGTWKPDLLEEQPRIGLRLVLRDENLNVVKKSEEFAYWTDTPDTQIKRMRLRLLVEAMCRYRNTGGSDFDGMGVEFPLHNVLRAFHQLPAVQTSPEWKLWHTQVGEHVYEKDDKAAYLFVVEDEFTEVMNPDQFLDWQRNAVATL